LLDIRILTCALLATDDIERALRFYNKAMQILDEEHSKWERYERIKLVMPYNLSVSLLKASYLKLHDKNPNVDIEKTFSDFTELVLSLSKKKEFRKFNLVVKMRKQLFENEIEGALKVLRKIGEFKNKDFEVKVQDEIDHYNFLVNKTLGDRIFKVWVSRAILHFRKTRKITQRNLSDMTNMYESTISDIENQRTVISGLNLYVITEAFKVELKEFINVGKSKTEEAYSKFNEACAKMYGLTDHELDFMINSADFFHSKRNEKKDEDEE